ncbi:glucosamine-6-phosphate deaminase [Marinomonas aquiplantarum]|uniref:Glucosamine-6-phosphate deaminase n=1 Tax=Marinomonas aquiplantarum TaxID=491951 RepID=A0A366CXJ2_9GAMM|nr:glucosamine-6-phosphate deaminase [Marinomonas aquiplantarum]RBO82366.1 glucosamine-6-phosphate deaminase [Marinomonas aquiplantarum]
MRVIILDTANQVAQYAADLLLETVRKKSRPVLGLATGSTPISTYQQVINAVQAGQASFKNTTTFNLDEYIGIDDTHPQSYRHFMKHYLFNHIDIDLANTHLPMAASLDETRLVENAQDYENAIQEAGGIDLQLLGIGENGHIGFNEPTSSLRSRTRIKSLSESTIEANKRFFADGEYQPHLALTMGIETILESKHVLLLATGHKKAAAVKAMVEGPLTAMCPASALQQHAKACLVLDQDAAAQLSLKDYYVWCEKQRQELT